MSTVRCCKRRYAFAHRQPLRGGIVLSLGLAAPLAHAICDPAHALPTFGNIASGVTVTNFDALGCIDSLFIANGGLLRNTATAGLTNDVDAELRNLGTIDSNGTIVNNGSIVNLAALSAEGFFIGTVNSRGYFSNVGSLQNYGTFSAIAGFSNQGTVRTANGVFTNSALFANDGSVAVQAGSFINTATGFIDNTRTFTVDFNGQFSNQGTIENRNGATLQITYSPLHDLSGGTINNRGTLIFPGGIVFDGSSWGTINLMQFGELIAAGMGVGAGYTQVNDGGVSAASATNSGTLINNGVFSSSGYFYNALNGTFGTGQGVLTNNKTFVVESGSTFFNNYRIFNNGDFYVKAGRLENGTVWGNELTDSTLFNDGKLFIEQDGQLLNRATISNSGWFRNNGTLENAGIFGNYGAFINNQTLLNSGTFGVSPGSGFINTGVIENRSTGRILLSTDDFNFNGGTLNNSGILHSTVFVDFGSAKAGAINLLANGTFENHGGASVASGYTLRNAGFFGNYGASLTLFGALESSGKLGIDAGSTLTIQAGGRLSTVRPVVNATVNSFSLGRIVIAAGGQAIVGDGFSNIGAIQNDGDMRIASSGVFYGGGPLLNSGTLTVDGTFRNEEGSLVNSGRLTISGRLFNFNESALTLAAGSNFRNSGVIENLRSNLENGGGRIYLDSPNFDFSGGTLNNSGRFRSTVFVDFGSSKAGTINLLAGGNFWNVGGASVASGYTLKNAGTFFNELSSLTLHGALESSGRFYIGVGSTLTIPAGGRLSTLSPAVGDFLTTGTHNSGRIVIAAGGQAIIGDRFDSTGAIQNDGDMRIAPSGVFSGNGLVNSGTLAVDGTFRNGPFNSLMNTGDVFVKGRLLNESASTTAEGSIRNNGGNFYFESGSSATGSGDFIQTSGLTVADGVVSISTVQINGGRLCGTGIISANFTLADGVICPGHSPGTLTISGAIAITDGILEMEIAGPGAGQFDVLHLTGHISFMAGVLELEFLNGYLPLPGQQWKLLVLEGDATGVDRLVTKVQGLPDGFAFDTRLDAEGNLLVTVLTSPVPELPTSWLLGIGLALVASLRTWRRDRRGLVGGAAGSGNRLRHSPCAGAPVGAVAVGPVALAGRTPTSSRLAVSCVFTR